MGNGQMEPHWGLRGVIRKSLGLVARAGLVTLVVFTQLSPVGGSEERTALERRQFDQGELVVKTRQVEGYSWPEVTVYRQVAASPKEVMAVSADFESQVRYLAHLVESRIVKPVSQKGLHVSYEYEITGPNEAQREGAQRD